MAPSQDSLSGLTGFIGGACSSGCIYAEGPLFRMKTTMIASGCTSASVVQQGYPTVFRLAWTDADQAIVSAQYVRTDLGAKRVAVVYDSTAYGRALSAAFKERIRIDGGTVVDFEITPTGRVNLPLVASSIKASGVEAVFFAVGRSDSAAIFVALQPSVSPLAVVASDSVLGAPSGGLPGGLVAIGLAKRGGVWNSEIQRGLSNPELFTDQNADAERLYVAALNRVAVKRPDGSLEIGRKQLRDELARMKIQGDTGMLSFGSYGERLHDIGAEVDRIDDGQTTSLRQYKR
jgi:branched-chain amino acid transport system substrate-binding protein